MQLPKTGGQVKIMDKISWESLPKEQKAAIAKHYQREFNDIVQILIDRIASLTMQGDQIGFKFLSDFVFVLLRRGVDHLWGEDVDEIPTVKGWPKDLMN